MRKLSLKVDLSKLENKEGTEKLNPLDLASRMVSNIMYGYATQQRGLLKADRSKIYNIEKKLKEAVKNNVEEIDLEDTESGFIRKCLRDTKLTPNEVLEQMEANIDAIQVD